MIVLSLAMLALACAESKQAPIRLAERQVDVSQMNRAAEFASRLLLGWNEGRFEELSANAATPRIIGIMTAEKQRALFEESLQPLCGRFNQLLYTETLARGKDRIYCFRGVFQNGAVQPEIIVSMNEEGLVSDLIIRLPK